MIMGWLLENIVLNVAMPLRLVLFYWDQVYCNAETLLR